MTKRKTTEQFIAEARAVHGDKYDYSKTKYINTRTKVEIVCPKHGPFWQKPNKHTKERNGCPKCARERLSNLLSKTTEQFVKEARSAHGDKYDYSKAEYKGNKAKVCIICQKHGEFWQTPTSHLRGEGCPKCAGNSKITKKEFITRAHKTHGNKYNYSKVEYKNYDTKVCIICPKHGEFWQTPHHHLNGHGCPECGKSKVSKLMAISVKQFIEKARKIHGNKYDYSQIKYTNNKTKICIICPEHGEFWQIAKDHLIGKGCPECGIEKAKKSIPAKTTEQFMTEARSVHGNKYDYSKIEYTNSNTKIRIICPEHGEFWQTPAQHINAKQGCPKCALNNLSKKFSMGLKEFISRARKIHGHKYDYSEVEYNNNRNKVKIICPKHGPFWQMATNHLSGHGCPRCAVQISKPEQEIADWVGSLGLETIQSYRGWCQERPNLEIDIFIPELNIGIEYHGVVWHSEKFRPDAKTCHHEKFLLARQNKIKLIQIFSNEWETRQNQIKSFLRSVFGKNEVRIGVRQCKIITPDKKEARAFLEKYHIQGASNGTKFIGLKHPDHGLVIIAQFGHHHRKTGTTVLQRFCGKENVTVAGGLSKIMKHFNEYCVTWSDNRWTDGKGYERSGFIKEKELGPDYFYVNESGNAYSKQSQKKQNVNCPEGMTEKQWCETRGLFRVWDAGKTRWLWQP